MRGSGAWGGWILAGICLAGALALLLHAPIPQDPSYHSFADTRTILGIPNFWNVISNAPFLFVGSARALSSSSSTGGFSRRSDSSAGIR